MHRLPQLAIADADRRAERMNGLEAKTRSVPEGTDIRRSL